MTRLVGSYLVDVTGGRWYISSVKRSSKTFVLYLAHTLLASPPKFREKKGGSALLHFRSRGLSSQRYCIVEVAL